MRISALPQSLHAGRQTHDSVEAAAAYDAAGQTYQTYADGNAGSPFEFTSRYSYADKLVWALCKLEERCNTDPVLIDRATHILLHANRLS